MLKSLGCSGRHDAAAWMLNIFFIHAFTDKKYDTRHRPLYRFNPPSPLKVVRVQYQVVRMQYQYMSDSIQIQ